MTEPTCSFTGYSHPRIHQLDPSSADAAVHVVQPRGDLEYRDTNVGDGAEDIEQEEESRRGQR